MRKQENLDVIVIDEMVVVQGGGTEPAQDGRNER
jgi:hypothetical protein